MTKVELIPAVLAYDEQDFKARLLHPELNKRAKLFHLDVLDGTLFGAKAWAEAQIIGSWPNLPEIELHLMVQSPLPIVVNWHKNVPSLRRVIVHLELGHNITLLLASLKELNLQVVVAVNPQTLIDDVAQVANIVDGIQIMGVEPGKSGQPFLGEPIIAKIRRAKALFPNLPVALDGGLRVDLVLPLMAAGVDRLVAASALWQAPDPGEAYDLLEARLS